MSPVVQRLQRARRQLSLALAVSALGWTIAIAGLVWVAGSRLLASQIALILIATLLAISSGTLLYWRRRQVRSVEAIALWIEERQPELEYTLVTATDPHLTTQVTDELARRAEAADIEGLSRRASLQLLTRAAAAVLVMAIVVSLLGVASRGSSASGPVLVRRTELPNRLAGLEARVTPPAYTHLGTQQLDDPSTIEALVGSSLSLEGAFEPQGIQIAVGKDTQPAVARPGGWKSEFKMPPLPAAVTLTDREYRRLIVLAPRPDSAPQVVLTAPLHDTTYQVLPSTPLRLEARTTDDLELVSGYFEFLISTGTGENFITVSRNSVRQKLAGKAANLAAAIRLDTLKLTPGSVVNIRAVAFDGNDVSGPGKGVSETRTLRLAEKLDSANVTAAPPDQIDSMLISQRLLNLRTDTLIRNKRTLGKTGVADRSMTYSNVQETIRQRVMAVITVLEDDGVGGTSPTEVSLMLRKAGDEMQSARIDLALALPDTARPHMRRALAILDEIRNSHRYYLRGLTRPVMVDVSKVRMTGQGDPAPASRAARERLRRIEIELAGRIETAVGLHQANPQGTLDSLTLIQVSALATHPAVAKELGSAIGAIRTGTPVDAALIATRRLLSPAPALLTGPAEWGGTLEP